MIEKRSFISPVQNEKDYRLPNPNLIDKAQGRSASHGLERNFKGKRITEQMSEPQQQIQQNK